MNSVFRVVLTKLPRTKKFIKKCFDFFRHSFTVSSNYVPLNSVDIDIESKCLRSAWQSSKIPQRQRDLVDKQLEKFKLGMPVDVFDIMVEALKEILIESKEISILEVGCSSGYYSEVLEFAGLNVKYTGCDYSESFILLARKKYPHLYFDIEDATSLSYGDNNFDVVISGCCLLHIPEYEQAVAESVRVARRYVIFHRTPVVNGYETIYYKKQAYGVETVEIHFNELQFLRSLENQGLDVIRTWTLSQEGDMQLGGAVRTYLCRKFSY